MHPPHSLANPGPSNRAQPFSTSGAGRVWESASRRKTRHAAAGVENEPRAAGVKCLPPGANRRRDGTHGARGVIISHRELPPSVEAGLLSIPRQRRLSKNVRRAKRLYRDRACGPGMQICKSRAGGLRDCPIRVASSADGRSGRCFLDRQVHLRDKRWQPTAGHRHPFPSHNAVPSCCS